MSPLQQRAMFILATGFAASGCQCATTGSPGGGPPDTGLVDQRIDVPILDSSPSGSDVRAVITADNSYGFGWGNATSIANYFGRPASPCACAADIFSCPVGRGPEEYIIPAANAPADAYLYIIAWADRATTQGLIATFQRVGVGPSVQTGDASLWEVCATGIEYGRTSNNGGSGGELLTGPPQEEINAQIAVCNAGTGSPSTTSAGWVNQTGAVTPNAIGSLVVGEANSTGGFFPLVCEGSDGIAGMPAEARWIWYSPTASTSAFNMPGANSTRTFLIFRISAGEIPLG